jgi:hypothetical protein
LYLELEDGPLGVQDVGHDQLVEVGKEQANILTHLKAYKEELFWGDIKIPNGT